ncbi:MAG: polysaccharide pyruvyl transferase family protein [Candidatus Bathyarchaeota archaeon]|uniref:polysaccharide pyruvyl transferase family protein n=1 Tax=Candidatus Bathycorpusculum sp. TaxID=2994959 RepID=UPI0028383F35|nr:polysaccharide pyruvyl transferase family protein [Candidatus Termiticorpusculum sp.]MCL2256907.1 polysaccharide pyruvyl transferase family protein [Candidatus Termiticorpusculum sp.]MCL2292969.1 polysaccharide pyruvyl transferase family protein [Candidatus Termiticorpusculum sp.]
MRVKKPFKILITIINTTVNNGESAMASIMVKSLKQVFPYTQLSIDSNQKETDNKHWKQMLPKERKDISLVGISSASKLSRKLEANAVIFRYIHDFLKTDTCIDNNGDSFSDTTQFSLGTAVSHSFQLQDNIVFRKPIVICAQSVGSFNNGLSCFIAQFVINNVNLVTVREKISTNKLKKLGSIGKPVLIVSSFFAFLLLFVSSQEEQTMLIEEKFEHSYSTILQGAIYL